MKAGFKIMNFIVLGLTLRFVHGDLSAALDKEAKESQPRLLQGCAKTDKVSLQLKWLIQSQFTGYVAGREIGGPFGNIYKQNCVLCQIRPGDPLLEPIDEVLDRFSDVGIVSGSSFLDRVTKNRSITAIGALHKANGMVLVALKDFCGRTDPPCTIKDFEGKTIGVDRDGRIPVRNLLKENNVNANLVTKYFGIGDLMAGKYAGASLMMFNEVGLIFESLNKKTGYLYQPDDVIIWDNLQPTVDELIVVRDDVLAARGHSIKNLLRGLMQAWTYCRDNEEECVNMLPNNDKAHQRFMLREILRMMYPKPDGFGHYAEAVYWKSAQLALEMGTIASLPSSLKVNNTLMDEARAEVIASGQYQDVNGMNFKKHTVQMCAPKYTSNFHICQGLEATLCPAGSTPTAHNTCGPCPVGRIAPEEDKGNVCSPCMAGKFASETGSTMCSICKPGSSQNSTGQHRCNTCVPGKFQDDIAATECKVCPKGTYTDLGGQEACERCPLGTYSNAHGQSSCTKCPSSFTTKYPGATAHADCICMIGSYDGKILHGSNAGCKTCGEGLLCDEPGLSLPKPAAGYYIQDGKIDQVYLCEPKGACMGGKWGESVCRKPRQGFLCMECPDGLDLNSDFEQDPSGCEECSTMAMVVYAIVPFLVLAFCIYAMYATHPSPLDEKPDLTEAQNSIGQLIMFIQVVNALQAARMSYGQPMQDFVNSMISHFDPDRVFSSAPCLLSAFSDPVVRYSLTIVAPVALMTLLSVIYLIGKALFRGILPLSGLLNIMGEILVEFYISITLAIFSPFNCYGHPNGDASVRNYPQVICGETSHGAMVGLSVFGILAYPLTAMGVAVFMTWQFPRRLLKSDITFLVTGRFLFERWRPDCYWFCNISLVRNFWIAVLPCVMPEDALDKTLLLMAMVLLIAFCLLIWFKPRRSTGQNRLDCFVSYVQFTLVAFGLTTVTGQQLSKDLSTICCLLIASVFVIVLSLFGARCWKIMMRVTAYAVYLSHHSGHGSCSCRVLHKVLLSIVKGTVFYDIDAKDDLGMIIDSARNTLHMVVAFGSETLCRPWCIASVVAAHRKGTPLHTVVFTHPQPQQTVCSAIADSCKARSSFSGRFEKSRPPLFEVDTFALRGYGVSQQDVHPALQAVTAVEPVFMNFLSEESCGLSELLDQSLGLERTTPVAAATQKLFQSKQRCSQLSEAGFRVAESVNLILSDPFDGDAVAVSRLFQSAFSQKGGWIEDQDLRPSDFATVVRTGKVLNTVFVFSQNTTKSIPQLGRLGLLHTYQGEMHMVPVAVGNSFEFPDQDFMSRLETGKGDFGLEAMGKIAICAGGQVTLKQICDGLAHVMTFLISFVNVPGLTGRPLEQCLLDVLTRATGSGRRTSISKQPPLLQPPEQQVQQQLPESTTQPSPLTVLPAADQDNCESV